MIKTDKDKNVKRKQFLFKMFHNNLNYYIGH